MKRKTFLKIIGLSVAGLTMGFGSRKETKDILVKDTSEFDKIHKAYKIITRKIVA